MRTEKPPRKKLYRVQLFIETIGIDEEGFVPVYATSEEEAKMKVLEDAIRRMDIKVGVADEVSEGEIKGEEVVK